MDAIRRKVKGLLINHRTYFLFCQAAIFPVKDGSGGDAECAEIRNPCFLGGLRVSTCLGFLGGSAIKALS
jgi:hypothetical protein